MRLVEVPDIGTIEVPDEVTDEQFAASLEQYRKPEPTEVGWPEIRSELKSGLVEGLKEVLPTPETVRAAFPPAPRPEEGIISPADIPTGAEITDYWARKGITIPKALTVPASAAAETAAGVVGYFTSPKGATEAGLAMTPAAPVILTKWAYDMLKGGVESVEDTVSTVAEMSRDAFARGMISANQLGLPPETTPTDEQFQRLARNAVNLVFMGTGGLAAGLHVPGRGRTAVTQLREAALPRAVLLRGTKPLVESLAASHAELASSGTAFSPADLLSKAATDESVNNSARRGAQTLSNILQPLSRLQESGSPIDVETQGTVMAQVVEASKNSQVAEAIIRLVPVDVMNDLTGKKVTRQQLLNDPAMLQEGLSKAVDIPVISRFLDSLIHKQQFTLKGEDYASTYREAKTFYGPLRAPAVEGAGQVPAEVGRPGVLPQPEAEAARLGQEAQVLLDQVRPAIRLVPAKPGQRGRIVIGQKGQVHDDIIERHNLQPTMIDQRGFVGPTGWLTREQVAAIPGLETAVEPGRAHAKDVLEAQAAGPRQPWQFTLEQFLQPHNDLMRKARETTGPLSREFNLASASWDEARRVHEDAVQDALNRGLPVPDEVMADYPDMKPEITPRAAAPGSVPPVIPRATPAVVAAAAEALPRELPAVIEYRVPGTSQSVMVPTRPTALSATHQSLMQRATDDLGMAGADALAKELLGTRGYAEAKKTADGRVVSYEIGIQRRTKTGKRSVTVRGVSTANFGDALRKAINYQALLDARAMPPRMTYLTWEAALRGGRAAERQRVAPPVQVGMTAEDTAYLEAERAAIDLGEAVGSPVTFGRQLTLEGLPPGSGDFAWPTREGIAIDRDQFAAWWNDDMRGLTIEQKRQALASVIVHEHIHRFVTDRVARDFWNDLSAPEKALIHRIYMQKWDRLYRRTPGEKARPEISDRNLGHEAIRMLLERLSKMTVTEVAQAAGLERAKLRTFLALKDAIFAARKAVVTRAIGRQIAELDGIIEKLNAGIVAAGAGAAPAARRPGQEWTREKAIKVSKDLIEGGINDPEIARLTAEGNSVPISRVRQVRNFLTRNGMFKEDTQTHLLQDDWLGKGYADEELGIERPPAARRPGGRKEIQPTFFLPEAVTKEPERGVPVQRELIPKPGVPPAERVTAEQAGAYVPTAFDLERVAEQEMAKLEGTPIEKVRPRGIPEFKPSPELGTEASKARLRTKAELVMAPDFRDFVDRVKASYGDVKPHQVVDMWVQNVHKYMETASGESYTKLRKALRLERNFGTGPVADPLPPVPIQRELTAMGPIEAMPPPTEPRRGLKTWSRQLQSPAQKYRRRLGAAIAKKLILQATGRPKYVKTSITSEDIGFGRETTVGAFHTITEGERSNFDTLQHVMTEGGLVGPMVSKSITRRVVALLDKQTGAVELVSVWKKPKTGAMIVNPEIAFKERNHVPLSQLPTRFQPILSILLDEPVQGFRQRFPNIQSFNDKIGKAAARQSLVTAEPYFARETERPMEPRAPTTEEMAIKVQRPYVARPGMYIFGTLKMEEMRRTPITRAEAGALIDLPYTELDDLTAPEDMLEVVNALSVKAREGWLTGQDRLFLTGLWKAAHEIQIASRETVDTPSGVRRVQMDQADAYRQALNEIYELIQNRKTDVEGREAFIQSALARYTRVVSPGVAAGRAAREALLATTRPEPVTTGARELTMRERLPPTVVRGAPPGIPRPLPEGRPELRPTPMLTEMERAYVERRAEEAALERAAEFGVSAEFKVMERPYQGAIMFQKTELPPGFRRFKGPKPTEPKDPLEELPEETAEMDKPPAARRPGTGVSRVAREAATRGGEMVTDVIARPLRWYSEWMTDRIRRVGGTASQIGSIEFNRIISRAKALYGELTPVLDPARKAAGRMRGGTNWLHRIERVTPNAGIANVVGAIEGTIPVPRVAQPTVELAKRANLAIGQLLEDVIPEFIATGKFQRNLTAIGYDLLRQGEDSPDWHNWTQALAQANNIEWSTVSNFFKKWKKILDDPAPDMNRVLKINQDFVRSFPRVITHLKVRGIWQEVVHANLYNYLENAAQRAAHTRAFREVWPNTKDGRRDFRQLDLAIRSELGPAYQKDYEGLIRTLQGRPTDNYNRPDFLTPGTPIAESFRFLHQTAGSLFAKMVLTGQMFVQPGENIAGSTPVFLGYRNYAEGMARVLQLYPELERQGAVNRVMYDWSFDPQSKVRSMFRIAGNVLSRGFMEQFLNELQEAGAAATARVVTERIYQGRLSKWEERMLPQTFRAMGFNRVEVRDMMAGDPILLGQFQRRAAAFLTSGNRAIAEGSRVGANRLINSIFRFQSYPMMKTNQLVKVTTKMVEAWRTGEETRAATEQFARFLFGNALQGALTVAITTWAYNGLFGAKIGIHEAEDQPMQFLTDAFVATMGGPLYLMWRGARGRGLAGIGEQATRAIFPYAIMTDMWDAAQGAGIYRDQSTPRRIAQFITGKLPGTRFIANGLAMAGLSQDNRDLDAAIAAFYRWRRQALGYRKEEVFLKEDERRKFRSAMRRAIEAIKDGKTDEYEDALAEAEIEAPDKPRERVKASIEARKILRGVGGVPLTDEQLDALRKHIGDDAYQLLEDFDIMLDGLAR